MILSPSLKLQILLTAAKTTNDMDVHVDCYLWNRAGERTKPLPFRTVSNGVTATTILAAPPQDCIYEPSRIAIYNKDTADKIAIVQTTDGTTVAIDVRISITTLHSLIWSPATDWYLT